MTITPLTVSYLVELTVRHLVSQGQQADKTPRHLSHTLDGVPLKLTERTLNRARGAPPFGQQLADHMRQGILTGDVDPGEPLPSVEAIQHLIGASRPVVRKAPGPRQSRLFTWPEAR
ncbi:GntR family transcriptional regulator [Kribbella albertanoniae]|uniref:GntR family transcriptional regulator n=1 Tax=Kribbella albertanoniae TaxID=1266829 RepID=A0A4R4P0S3_9ACTN|nr:GntR family transcriptional regulator [Kribbella albertanoniae]